MNVDDTVKKMIQQCPRLMYNRAFCYHHLFCTLGNGYKWEDGELVDKFEEPDTIEKELNDIEARMSSLEFWNIADVHPEFMMETDEYIEKEIKRRKNDLESMSPDVRDMLIEDGYLDVKKDRLVANPSGIYPIDYSYGIGLLYDEDDIKPDWKEALKVSIDLFKIDVDKIDNIRYKKGRRTLKEILKI